MLGAYIGLMMVGYGVNFWLAAVGAGIIVGLVGLGIERSVLRRVHKMMSEQALSTFGFLYIFTNVALWVWGPWAKMGTPPGSLSGSIEIGRLGFPVYRLALILLGLMIAVGLYWFQEKTRYGSIIRAGMDDKETTTGLGINYGLISSAVFALGTFIAGFAGSIGTPLVGAYLTEGTEILLLALIVVVVGGMGTIQGTLVGALIIGLIDSFGRAFFPDLAMFTIYLAMVIMLVIRPSGLVGRKIA
jgi:branched-chain amino acid transport system permease protein